MRIGMVCPYSFDVPGGVHFTSETSPSTSAHRVTTSWCSPLGGGREPPRLVHLVRPAGRCALQRLRGRLTFGPVTSARVGRWVDEGTSTCSTSTSP